jgi:hypothetical protein
VAATFSDVAISATELGMENKSTPWYGKQILRDI